MQLSLKNACVNWIWRCKGMWSDITWKCCLSFTRQWTNYVLLKKKNKKPCRLPYDVAILSHALLVFLKSFPALPSQIITLSWQQASVSVRQSDNIFSPLGIYTGIVTARPCRRQIMTRRLYRTCYRFTTAACFLSLSTTDGSTMVDVSIPCKQTRLQS